MNKIFECNFKKILKSVTWEICRARPLSSRFRVS